MQIRRRTLFRVQHSLGPSMGGASVCNDRGDS